MKKTILTVIFALLSGNVYAANTALPDMTEDETPTGDDLIYTTNAPATTPADRKVTITNLQAVILAGESDPATGAITGIVKADGAGNISAAVSGTDYETAGAAATVQALYNTSGELVTIINTTPSTKIDGEIISPPAAQAASTADSGDGNAATGTITPTVNINGPLLIRYTCNDTDGCTVTMSETGAIDNAVVIIETQNGNDCTFADSAGVQELPNTVTLKNANETIAFVYSTDRWVMFAAETNEVQFTSINLQSGTINGALKYNPQTAATYTMGTATADSWGSVIVNNDNDALAVTMESAAGGQQFCVKNAYGVTAALTVTPAAGDYLVSAGVRGTAATAYSSSGAAGDEICITCEDATNCNITKEIGTWTE